jgi:hypothetical protein
LRAVWMVKSRQIAARLSWWLTLTGYDRRDRSLTQRIYLVYVAVFWIFWLAAVLSLLAGPVATLLKILGGSTLNRIAAGLGALALLIWGLYQLWQASRRSPIVFSEEDAYLICQAPVPAEGVALTWFLGDWIEAAAPFLAGALTVSIALVDSLLAENIHPADLPAYLSAGLRAVLATALAQIGVMALVWAAGALRLQRDRRLRWQPAALRWLIVATGLGLAYTLARSGLAGLGQGFWHILLWPIGIILGAAFGAAPLGLGIIVGLIWAGLGLVALVWEGASLNLSRAAQETTHKAAIEEAQRYGQTELAQQITLRDRLGSGHHPARLPPGPGVWVLVWKDILQSSRSFKLRGVWNWLVLLGVGLIAILAPDPALRGLMLAIWSVMVGQRVTSRLQKDLGHWSLLRQLPFSSGQLLTAELALRWGLAVLTGWCVLAIAGTWPTSVRLQAGLLLLCVSAAASLATAYDLLGQARTDRLLNGLSPQNGALSGLLSILCLAIPMGIWFGLGYLKIDGSLPTMLAALLLAFGFWLLASRRLREVR